MLRQVGLFLLVVVGACTGTRDAMTSDVEHTATSIDAGPLLQGDVADGVGNRGAPVGDAQVPSHDAPGPGPLDAAARDPGAWSGDAGKTLGPVSVPSVAAGSRSTWSLCPALAARAGVSLGSDSVVSWAALLCDTVDLDRFTRPPAPAYKALMASSYNRASKQEGQDGWFANDDSGSYLRDQGDEHVMMEQTGPGVLTRIWSANPSGHIRIYIDDPKVAAIDAPMADFLAGKFEAPWGEPFVFLAGSGSSAYFPIPYSSYVRVTTTTDAKLYYHVESRAYPAGTRVEPFSYDGLRALSPLALEVAAFVANPSANEMLAALPVQELALDEAHPEQRVALGPAVVRELTIKGFGPDETKLRTTRLIISVDGELVVDAPLGDLFGSGPGLRPHDSLVSSMSAETMTLRWPMPVRGELVARVASSDGPAAGMTIALRYSMGVPDAARLFHARWTGGQELSSRTPVDWTVLQVEGEGWYVGTVLNVDNPTNAWWGEGDEKIFVDAESFPSHFGTGTEDYFGFAWCSTELATRPWLGQTRADGPGNAGRSSMYRWHLGDAIPFTSELRFRLEVLTWLKDLISVTLAQDAVAYWYALPGGTVAQATLDIAEFRVSAVTPVTLPALPGMNTCRL